MDTSGSQTIASASRAVYPACTFIGTLFLALIAERYLMPRFPETPTWRIAVWVFLILSATIISALGLDPIWLLMIGVAMLGIVLGGFSRIKEKGKSVDRESDATPTDFANALGSAITINDLRTTDDAILHVGRYMGIEDDRLWANEDKVAQILTAAASRGIIRVFWSKERNRWPFEEINRSEFSDFGHHFYKRTFVGFNPTTSDQMDHYEWVVGPGRSSSTFYSNPYVLRESLTKVWPPKTE